MPIILFLSLLLSLLFPISAQAAANVTFDNQGTWIVNGERFFLYGAHRTPRLKGHNFVDPIDWERTANHYHLNTVVTGGSQKMNDLATQNNMYLVQGIPWIKDRASWDNAEAKAKIRDNIQFSRHLFFYASEENIMSSGGPVIDGYDYLSSTFPNVPAHINFTNMATKYSPNMIDFLTRTKAAVISSHVGDAGDNTATMVRLRDEIPSLKSAYMLFRINENQRLEEDIFESIVKGINGIFFWEMQSPDPFAPSDTYVGANWGDVIARVGGYLAEIKPGLVAPNRDYQQGYMKSRGEDNRYYVIATASNLSVTGLPANTQFDKLFYNPGTVTTNSAGTLTDNAFGKIKIYRQKTSSSPTPTPSGNGVVGDLTGDGHVNLADYNKLVTQYGTTYNLSHYNRLVANYGR